MNRQFDDYAREEVELIRRSHMEEQGRCHANRYADYREQHRRGQPQPVCQRLYQADHDQKASKE